MKVYKILFLVFVFFLFSCEKFVEVDAPITSLNSKNVYSSDATAIAVLNGVLTNMSASSFASGGLTSMSLLPSLSSDEIVLFGGNTNATYNYYYANTLTQNNTGSSDFWSNIYPIIFSVNSAIEGVEGSSKLTSSIKEELLGEAKFIRAFCYFYLVNLYGDVPLVLTSNYKVNSILPRTPEEEIYNQILIDLNDAKSLMKGDFLDISLLNISTERVRPNKWTAVALLARVYLYIGSYIKAEAAASEIIDNSLFTLLPLTEVFLKNSQEAIWQLQPVLSGFNTQEARTFILKNGLNNWQNPFFISNHLLDAFESDDQRKVEWIGDFIDTLSIPNRNYYYPYKYKSATYNDPVLEYSMVMRLAEQYLIRAEAKVQNGDLTGGATDLNVIRTRAGLSNTISDTPNALLESILHERQIELFTEWGHRWLDLKRTKRINEVMPNVTLSKGGKWNSDWQFYPIPLSDLQRDPNLKQNQGY